MPVLSKTDVLKPKDLAWFHARSFSVSYFTGLVERRVTSWAPPSTIDTEDTSVSAVRELEEETGYRSQKVSFLLSLRTTVAFCDEFVDVYLAEDLEPGKQHLDDGESIEVETYTLEELCQMIYQGKIQDSKTVAAIMAYAAKSRGGL